MKKTFNPEKIRSNKVFFESRAEALAVADFRRSKVWKIKFGRHKGKHFVGSQLEFFNVD